MHLARYADEVILAEPSEQQLGLARAYLRDEPRVRPMPAPASDLALPDASVDAAMLVRVLHHLPRSPRPSSPRSPACCGGRDAAAGVRGPQPRPEPGALPGAGAPGPRAPVAVARATDGRPPSIPFVNHHPKALLATLDLAGFVPEAA